MTPAQELYVTSSKHDKLKISKAIVAAVRQFGGRFVEADENRGNVYFEIGDERGWKKTSQALREGQAEIRAQLAGDDAAGTKHLEYEQVISEQKFFAYACKILESLYYPTDGDSGIPACGADCPHAKRRRTINQLGAHPMQIYDAIQSLSPHISFPPPPVMHQQQLPQDNIPQYDYCYNAINAPGGANYNVSSMAPYQENVNLYEPLPFTASPNTGNLRSSEPIPYAPNRMVADIVRVGYNAAEVTAPQFHPNSFVPPTVAASNIHQIHAEPYANQSVIPGLQKPGRLSQQETSMGSVISLRKICSDDIEMSSEDGELLMELLNQEVEDLIRRKSYGLMQIDTTHAFEDLVYDDDIQHHEIKDSDDNVIRQKSSSTATRSSSSRISGLSIKDDLSLMNMSFLSLDDRDENEKLCPKEEFASQLGFLQRTISVKNDPSAPTGIMKRESRISFLNRMSLMSLDNGSFSQLVNSLSSQDSCANKNAYDESNVSRSPYDSPAHVISRKMGFPMRQTFIRKIGAERLASDPAQAMDMQSNLIISNASIVQNEIEFDDLAGQVQEVQNPMGVCSTLTLDSVQVNMLLGDIGGDLHE